MAETSPWIIDVTTAAFEKTVIDRSNEIPVVVDFWAPWCGPCRQLAPLLEKLAVEFDGQFLLAKVNIDAEEQLAAAFMVQSIPHVIALRDGKPVDQFAGLLPDDEIRVWIQSLLPTEAELLIKEAAELESSDPAAAEPKLREALKLTPDDAQASISLARVLFTQKQTADSLAIITKLEERGWLEPEAEKLKSEIEFQTVAEDTGGVDECRTAAEAEPDNLELQLKLADALAAGQQFEESLDICLAIIQREKTGIGENARETMVHIFHLVGDGSELANTFRRKLATALY